MNHKIKVKIGLVEIEYEGDESYLKNELPGLIDKVVALKNINSSEPSVGSDISSPITYGEKSKHEDIESMSVNTIAVKLGTTSSSDLVMASCAHLAFIQNKDTFHRNDIIREMKTASNYFKSNHIKNLSQSLKSLISSGKLIERSKDTFALSANETSTLKAKLK